MRNSNIELLRILAMLMIIGLHYWGGGVSDIAERHSNGLIYQASESLCICGVNLFVMITSWFSTEQNKINFLKIAKLLIEVAFWGIICLLLGFLVGWQTLDLVSITKAVIPYLWNNRWFVEAYVIFIMLIPFINAALFHIEKKQHGWLLMITFTLFILWPSFLPNPPIDDYGYGFLHFISVYILISYIRRFCRIIRYKLLYFIGFVLSFILILYQSLRGIPTCWMYNNIFVVLEALFLFLFFIQFDFRSRIVNLLASGAFGVFLIHSDRLFFGRWVYLDIFHANIYALGNAMGLVINFVFCLLVFYLGCFLLEMCRLKIFEYSVDRILDKCSFLNTVLIFKK